MSFQKNRKNPRREETIDLVRVPCSRCINFSLPSFQLRHNERVRIPAIDIFISRWERERLRGSMIGDIYSGNREQVAISHSYYLLTYRQSLVFPLAHRNVIIYERTLTKTMFRCDSTLLLEAGVCDTKSFFLFLRIRSISSISSRWKM